MSSQYKCIFSLHRWNKRYFDLQFVCRANFATILFLSKAKCSWSIWCQNAAKQVLRCLFWRTCYECFWDWFEKQNMVVVTTGSGWEETKWDASHVVWLPQCDQTADWGRFSSAAMIAVHAITCMRIAHVPRATNTGSVASCLCALLINVLPRRH